MTFNFLSSSSSYSVTVCHIVHLLSLGWKQASVCIHFLQTSLLNCLVCIVTTSKTEVRAACGTWFLTSPCFAHSIWEHDEPAGKCGLRRLQQSDWFTAMCGLLPPPVTGNVPWCPGWDGEACCGVWRWRWRSPLSLLLSLSRLTPTIVHVSILSFSLFFF